MDDDHARLRDALRRFDPQWLPDARPERATAASNAELIARLDALLEFWRREQADIRAYVQRHLDPGCALHATPAAYTAVTPDAALVDMAVVAAMRELCRHPPQRGDRWAALRAVLRRRTR